VALPAGRRSRGRPSPATITLGDRTRAPAGRSQWNVARWLPLSYSSIMKPVQYEFPFVVGYPRRRNHVALLDLGNNCWWANIADPAGAHALEALKEGDVVPRGGGPMGRGAAPPGGGPSGGGR
jgi:hypothetical protein